MADISKITIPSGSTYDLKDATARSSLSNKQDKITAITAQTTQAVYPIKIDSQGHITAYGSAVTSMAPTAHTHSANDLNGGYINIHPENGPVIIPFIHNDIAHLLKRGGSASVTKDGTAISTDLNNCFDGTGSYWSISPSGVTTLVITLTLHKTFGWTNTIYVDFGASGWRSNSVKIEVMNSSYASDAWTQKYNNTANTLGHVYVTTSHTPVGASNSGAGFNKIRLTFSSFNSGFRISQIGVYNYGSAGLRETYMSRGDDDHLFRSITPNANNTYSLGSSSLKWKDVYAGTLNGTSIPDSPKFTDTTYGANRGISNVSGNFGHSNTAITAQNTQALYPIKIDAYGHITAYGSAVSVPTESTVSGWGFTKNAGTITGIKMNGASKGTSGVVDLGTVLTSHQDISGKVDKINITAQNTQALYPIKINAQGQITAYGSAVSVPTESTVSGWGFTKNAGTVTSVRVQATSPITSSQNTAQTGTLNTTIAHANSGVTAGSYGSATAVPVITVNATGHVTAVSTATPSVSVTINENTEFNISGTTFKINLVT